VEFHGIPAERVAVTGAQPFDRWFDREPAQTREAFCAMVGLPDTRPFVLFTGSSVFIARSEIEVPFVRRWIEALRASADPALRAAAVLVRPHPFNADARGPADFSGLGRGDLAARKFTPAAEPRGTPLLRLVVLQRGGRRHQHSAMVEAAILCKPVLSLLTPKFAGTGRARCTSTTSCPKTAASSESPTRSTRTWRS
jgi:hypothetical protein